jgi:hypothetical protein
MEDTMTESDDRVDAAIEAFLDHLDGRGDEPDLHDLDEQERARVGALVASLRAGRGIDPFASRPSLEQLLAGTPLEAAVPPTEPGPPPGPDLLDEIRRRLRSYLPFHVAVWPDTGAAGLGIGSGFVALIAAQRLRLAISGETASGSDLAQLDPVAAAGPVYGAFPDTAGVIVIHPDADLSSVAIDPFDVEDCIATPSGSSQRPRVRRPVLPLADTVRAYLDEVGPVLDAGGDVETLTAGEVDVGAVALTAAGRAVEAVAAAGRRAKIRPKRDTWSALGQPEIDAIGDLVLDAIAGLDEQALAARIADLGEAA